ncbi:hypothetical protein E4U41_003680, partial [Claviceps citrina]
LLLLVLALALVLVLVLVLVAPAADPPARRLLLRRRPAAQSALRDPAAAESDGHLTVPIVNTLAFLFTVLGEWYVEGKVISRDTAVGMVLSLVGIALCVQSKS